MDIYILLGFCRQINREKELSQVALNPLFLWVESMNLICQFLSRAIGELQYHKADMLLVSRTSI